MPVIASEERLARWAALERRRREPGWRRRLPRWTVRLRLTLLYGVLFLVTGAALLAITYGLVAGDPELGTGPGFVISQGGPARLGEGNVSFVRRGAVHRIQFPPVPIPPSLRATAVRLQHAANAQVRQSRSDQLAALVTRSGIALAIMALISIGLGWLMAGRALRPVRTMNARVRQISEHNLHERLAVSGHDDEFKELGDAFDGLLGRLENAFESQKRFVANASHELRTPVTLERTLLEVALADPDADAESLRAVCGRVLAAGEQQERTINALLTLARSQRGLEVRSEFDLADVVGEVAVDSSEVRVERTLGDAPASGDPALVERLVANLLDNAVRHNEPGGWARISTATVDGRGVVRVVNTGPEISPSEITALHEPFRRLGGERTGHGGGVGLGLSIVDAIARAHGASVSTVPRAGGGLEAEVSFPPVV